MFDFPTPQFGRLAETIRLATFEAAAREKVNGLIFTLVYAAPEDDPFIEKMIGVVAHHGGKTAFVRLRCDRAAHEERVRSGERHQFGKITSPEQLRGALARWNLDAAVPFRDSLEIDNSRVTADAVAARIAAHFSLPIGRS